MKWGEEVASNAIWSAYSSFCVKNTWWFYKTHSGVGYSVAKVSLVFVYRRLPDFDFFYFSD